MTRMQCSVIINAINCVIMKYNWLRVLFKFRAISNFAMWDVDGMSKNRDTVVFILQNECAQ